MAEYMLSVGAMQQGSRIVAKVPGNLSSIERKAYIGFTASRLFAVMYSFEAHCGLICRLHSFLSSHMYNPIPSQVIHHLKLDNRVPSTLSSHIPFALQPSQQNLQTSIVAFSHR